MNKVRLGDVATYINGYAFKPDDWGNEGRPIIRIQDLTGNGYQANRFAGSVPEKYNVVNGDVLISWSASLGVYVWQGENAVLNQHIFKVVFDKAAINKEFFIHQVSGILKNAANEAHGATMKHLTKPVFDALPFVLPDIEEQNRIAEILSKAKSLIESRKRQLTELDNLVKARFVEIFGDPVVNPKEYLVCTLQELVDSGYITYHLDGNHGSDYPKSEEFVGSGIPYISANCIVDGEIDFSKAKYLTIERAGKLRKGIAKDADVLFAHNATVGPTAVLHTREEKVILGTSLTAYRCNHKLIVPNYLKAYMLSDGFVRQYSNEMKQTTRNQVPITVQKKYLFLIPPIEEQNEFATFVAQVDKSKIVVQKALDEAQTLFDSLMQEYFG